ncbi:hypothetical protein GCM10010492_54320 [Saccharothrix mutabilis subsp. mutabilis]|uniref:TetR family transcriptional regulator n=1 Tax=Saccharothrix mutabilis subsp. mutabilis TaxID=66855 RepID=A0ABN0UE96_9PSEU
MSADCGSVYHHFPGGRAQLIDEAVALAGDFVAGLIETAAEEIHDPLARALRDRPEPQQ